MARGSASCMRYRSPLNGLHVSSAAAPVDTALARTTDPWACRWRARLRVSSRLHRLQTFAQTCAPTALAENRRRPPPQPAAHGLRSGTWYLVLLADSSGNGNTQMTPQWPCWPVNEVYIAANCAYCPNTFTPATSYKRGGGVGGRLVGRLATKCLIMATLVRRGTPSRLFD